MDGDVQQHYLAAEQAYGDGHFAEAQSIASTLLARLNTASNSVEEEEARLAWRAFVTLLLGHIYFHGLNQPEQALNHYQLALENQPPDTCANSQNRASIAVKSKSHSSHSNPSRAVINPLTHKRGWN